VREEVHQGLTSRGRKESYVGSGLSGKSKGGRRQRAGETEKERESWKFRERGGKPLRRKKLAA